MKKPLSIALLIVTILTGLLLVLINKPNSNIVSAKQFEAFGAEGIELDSSSDNSKMLQYSFQEELLNQAQYRKISETFIGNDQIIQVIENNEERINTLRALCKDYDTFSITPSGELKNRMVSPETLEESIELLKQMELINLLMYDEILTRDISSDIKDIYNELKSNSMSSLKLLDSVKPDTP